MNIGRKGAVGTEPAALAGDCREGRGAWEVSERGTKEGPRVGARTGRRPPRTPFLGRLLGAIAIAFSLVATAFIVAASHVMAHDDDDDDDGGDNATLTVDDDGAQCPLAYATIQGAVDAA